MKKLYILIIPFFIACGSKKTETTIVENTPNTMIHNNILIIPDLSSNLELKKSYTDDELIAHIMGNFPKICTTNKRLMNQKDRIRMKLANGSMELDMQNFVLDVGQFEKQLDRIQYLKNNKNSTITYQKDSLNIIENLKNLYTNAKNYPQTHEGKYLWFDVWNFLNTQITDKDATISNPINNEYVKDSVRNILIILTDGYIEAGKNFIIKEGSKENRLSGEMISNFRNDYKKANATDVKTFFAQQHTGILAVKNPTLHKFEVLVLELYDRNLNEMGISKVHPTDVEITKLYWEDFLEKSGVKKYKIVPHQKLLEDAKIEINSFLGI